ncbi:MAG: hypothetical protein M1836_000882 [Candelina mexicana]|nr:MAG: hypothetical protein M1836_000882 [Candelina mexicana]
MGNNQTTQTEPPCEHEEGFPPPNPPLEGSPPSSDLSKSSSRKRRERIIECRARTLDCWIRVNAWLDNCYLESVWIKDYRGMYISELSNCPTNWDPLHDVWLVQHAYFPTSHPRWNAKALVLGLESGYAMEDGAVAVVTSEEWVLRRLNLLWESGFFDSRSEEEQGDSTGKPQPGQVHCRWGFSCARERCGYGVVPLDWVCVHTRKDFGDCGFSGGLGFLG